MNPPAWCLISHPSIRALRTKATFLGLAARSSLIIPTPLRRPSRYSVLSSDCESKHRTCHEAGLNPTSVPGDCCWFKRPRYFYCQTCGELRPAGSIYFAQPLLGRQHLLRTALQNYQDRLSDILFANLSNTFQDAIRSTAGLKLQYILIDSLCISRMMMQTAQAK